MRIVTEFYSDLFLRVRRLKKISDQELIEINWYVNSRPLKRLNWKLPIKVFIQKMCSNYFIPCNLPFKIK